MLIDATDSRLLIDGSTMANEFVKYYHRPNLQAGAPINTLELC
jgi:hypothetical protein